VNAPEYYTIRVRPLSVMFCLAEETDKKMQCALHICLNITLIGITEK